MSASKAKNLSSLLRNFVRTKPSSSSSAAATERPVQDPPLKKFVSAIRTAKSTKSSKPNTSSSYSSSSSKSKHAADLGLPTLELETDSSPGKPRKRLSEDIYSILCVETSVSSPDSEETNNDSIVENVLEIPWFSTLNHNNISAHRKEVLRERKQKWIFKRTQGSRFNKLVQMCASKLGTEATVQVFGRLGRETGLKEYNALIGICVEKAKASDDEDVALEQICKAFQLFNYMKEQGFELEEETYSQLLMYLIDMGMIEEFHFFSNTIRDGNPCSVPRLGYYEMLLWIGVNDEQKIWELCNSIAANDEGDYSNLQENYLLALCETDRKNDLLKVLETIDITKISSPNHVASIFKSFGRLLLESSAEKYFSAFKVTGHGAEDVSTFIFSYASSIPNLAVEDIVLKFKDLHSKLEMTPASASYEKLIAYSCDLRKVHVALDMIDQMCEAGLTPSINALNSILHASEEIHEFNLVWRIYSLINHHKLKPNSETFRSMISSSVKLKDFEGAYNLLDDMKKMDLMPTVAMYNTIMAGYFRKKDIQSALMVLKKMELADVKPDSQTFSCLIYNCDKEEDIIKYYEELKCAGVQVTKHVLMALINAYAACGEFEKAKQVVLEKGMSIKNSSEIKGTLVTALTSHGQISDAFSIFEEIKQAGCDIEPKVVISLIDHVRSEEELSGLIQLLEELHDDYWIEACCRLFLHSIRYKNLSVAIDLFRQLKDELHDDELAIEGVLHEVFAQIAETEPPDVQIGLDLLQAIKDQFGLSPPRRCLDFLLSACINAKSLKNSLLIWIAYENAGLPYDMLSYLLMYQAFLASGDRQSARRLLSTIPKDDPHVRYIIQACKETYKSTPRKKKQEKKQKD
ncbi:hypothetical protein Q3G72_006621 [Acer saccharum]|nr:hypothetical protein Q3G72_006621 [Acer saccharum]